MFDAPATAPTELRDYLRVLRRRIWVILAVTLIVVGVGLGWSLTRDKTYTASGSFISTSTGSDATDVTTQISILQSDAVHSLALKQFANAIPVQADQNGTSTGVTVSAESGNPKLAADSVNAHLAAYVSYVRQQALDRFTAVSQELQPQMASLQAQINALDAQVLAGVPQAQVASQRAVLSGQLATLQGTLNGLQVQAALAGRDIDVISQASPPTAASSPNTRQDFLIALGAGLLLGVMVAFVLEFLDDSIRSREDLVTATGRAVPVMGVIPAARSARAEVVSLTAPNSPAAEAYRSLRTAVHFAGLENHNCIEVTTPRTRHGKTETLVNLAVLAARAGRRVVVVDCDFRNPRVHEYFSVSNDVGFTSVVYGEPLSTALQRVPGVERLYVLTSGPIPPQNPAELLATERCHELLRSLEGDDTLVLVDTPPLLLVTDAAALAPAVGGVLLVAAARVSRRKQIRQALELLRQIDAPVLGTVLYQADSSDSGGYGEEVGRRARRQARRRQQTYATRPDQQPAGAVPSADAAGKAGTGAVGVTSPKEADSA